MSRGDSILILVNLVQESLETEAPRAPCSFDEQLDTADVAYSIGGVGLFVILLALSRNGANSSHTSKPGVA